MKKYKLKEKRKKVYLAIGLLALIGFCGCMNSQELEHLQEVEKMQTTVEYIPVETPKEDSPYYDIPLSEELQDFVVKTAKEYGIEPELVFAVIEKESNYNSDAIGDGGDSKGLMQVQPKWHEKRMNKLGVETLMNPYGNVLVGIDILAEKIEKHGEIGGLVAYNKGHYDGYITNYAKTVLEIKERLNGDRQ